MDQTLSPDTGKIPAYEVEELMPPVLLWYCVIGKVAVFTACIRRQDLDKPLATQKVSKKKFPRLFHVLRE